MHRYSAHGLRLESEIELPELDSMRDAPTCDPTPVTICIGSVPNELPGSRRTVEGYLVTPNQALFRFSGTAHFLITDGRHITIAPAEGHNPAWLRIVLLSGALGILLHQRGLFPLHASAIVADGYCIAFAGNSGDGKSTLAAALSRRGYRLLAEDKLVIRKTDRGWMAWPAIPMFHLYDEAVTRSGVTVDTVSAVSSGEGKFIHPALKAYDTAPRPLKAIYMLDWAPAGMFPTISPMTLMEAFLQMRQHASMHGLIPAMGREQAFMDWASSLLGDIGLFGFSRPQEYASLDDGLDILATHWVGS